MMTQTHLLVAAAMFCRPGRKRRNLAVIAGALLPDLAIFILFAYALLAGIPQSELWREVYWSEPWQSLVTIGNSAPLYLALLGASLLLGAPKDARPVWQSLPALLALAALTHLAGDFPLHNDDAHIHFWPFTDWRFHSPVSYWDAAHFGQWVGLAEAVLSLALIFILSRRFKAVWVRALLGLAMLGYLAVPAFFFFTI